MAKPYDIRPTFRIDLDHRLSNEVIDRAVGEVAQEHNLLLRRAIGASPRGREVPIVEFYDYDFDFWKREEGEVSESQSMTRELLSDLLDEKLQPELEKLGEEVRSLFEVLLRRAV